jgi:nucleotide-binding universal stress UspA family protein
MFKNILIAVDGSEHALRAARVAGEMARCMQADLRVVTVFDPIPAYLGQPNLEDVLVERLNHAEKALKDALQEIGTIPGKLTQETLQGPAAEAILAVIDAREIDLVVMGVRGLGRLGSLFLGSQSQKVVGHATCPVLLVR